MRFFIAVVVLFSIGLMCALAAVALAKNSALSALICLLGAAVALGNVSRVD
jgi:hypothetical protein